MNLVYGFKVIGFLIILTLGAVFFHNGEVFGDGLTDKAVKVKKCLSVEEFSYEC